MKNRYRLLAGVLMLILLLVFIRAYKNYSFKELDIILDEDETDADIIEEEPVEEVAQIELEFNDYKFWTSKIEEDSKILMTNEEIKQFNINNIDHCEELLKLEETPESISKGELRNLINNISILPKVIRYDVKGNVVSQDFYNSLQSNMNMGNIKESNSIQYGMITDRTIMRTFPTYEGSYSSIGDLEFDRFVETAIYPWEPVVIYLESKDKEWVFGSIYNYSGWIPKKDIGLGEKEDIFKYTNQENFLVVIDKQIVLEDIIFDMGVKIPLIEDNEDNYKIAVPKRDSQGKLIEKIIKTHSKESFTLGYLPYNKENLLKQAFKFYGETYGWGGMNNTRDCSAFILDIHRTFGLILPRNSSQQGNTSLGKAYRFSEESLKERLEILDSLAPGTALYMPGHAMLYLGKDGDEHYVIHQFAGYYEEENNKYIYKPVMKTDITTVTIKNSKGKTYMETIYAAKEFVK